MRATKAVILLLLFCAQMLVFTLERGYCSGRMVKIELNGKHRVCTCDHEVVAPLSDGPAIDRTPCCFSETLHKQFNELTVSSEVEVIAVFHSPTSHPLVFAHAEWGSDVGFEAKPNPPPAKRKSKPFIRFGNFKVDSTVA